MLIAIALFLLNLPTHAIPRAETLAEGTDALLKKPAHSIISLYGAFNEILLALGAKDLIAARTDSDANLKALEKLPSIGTHMRPDPEKIISLAPDLVLGLKGRQDALESLQTLKDCGIPVILLKMDNFDELFAATETLGKLTGHETEAKWLTEDWKTRLNSLKKNNGQIPRPKIFYEARYPNLLAAGSKGIVNAIIEAAGAENIIKIPKKLARINEEWLLANEPDFYIMQKGPMNPAPVPLAQRENLAILKTANREITVDEKMFSRPGPNSIQAAEFLSEILRKQADLPVASHGL